MFVLKNLTFATMILYQLGLEMTWVVITLALGCVQAKQHILEAQCIKMPHVGSVILILMIAKVHVIVTQMMKTVVVLIVPLKEPIAT